MKDEKRRCGGSSEKEQVTKSAEKEGTKAATKPTLGARILKALQTSRSAAKAMMVGSIIIKMGMMSSNDSTRVKAFGVLMQRNLRLRKTRPSWLALHVSANAVASRSWFSPACPE